jgi:hypothetical protein
MGRKSDTECPKSIWIISGILSPNVLWYIQSLQFEYLGNPQMLSPLSPYSKVQLNVQTRLRDVEMSAAFSVHRERG